MQNPVAELLTVYGLVDVEVQELQMYFFSFVDDFLS